MEIALVIVLALALNMAGAVIAKYLAMSNGFNVLCVALFALLLVSFGMRVVFWIVVGKRWQLSFIYPVLSINYLISFLLGMYLFNEPFHLIRCLGACIIAGGVLVVSLSEHRYERRVP